MGFMEIDRIAHYGYYGETGEPGIAEAAEVCLCVGCGRDFAYMPFNAVEHV
jgi:hypothetical protein